MVKIFRIPIVLLTICFFQVKPSLADCNEFCECDRPDKRVICEDEGLTEIPNDMPADTKAIVIAGKPGKEFKIKPIKKYIFQNLNDLEEISITFAGVEEISSDSFQNLKQLKRINLEFNKISAIYQSTFKGLDDLEVINLNGNSYCDVQVGSVSNLPSLRNLYLADLNIRRLNPSFFDGLDSLLHLDISGNNLRKLDKDLFDPLKNLVSLDLSGNNLRGLQDDLSGFLSKLTALTLGDNPWQCNCDLRWLKSLPAKFIYDASTYSPSRVVMCNGPSNLVHKNLVDVPDNMLTCIPPSIKDCVKVSVLEAQSYMISCSIKGDPFPDITWSLPDKSKVTSDDPDIDTSKYSTFDNGTLEVYAADLSENGQWKIEVRGNNGADDTTVMVNVTSNGLTTTPKQVSQTTEMANGAPPLNAALIGGIAGGVVAFICFVIILAVCCKNKKNKVQSDVGEGGA